MTIDHGPSYTQPDGHFSVLPEAECLELLTSRTVGRIAFVNHEGLQLIPLNFAMIDGGIYFRTAIDSVLSDLAEGMEEVVFAVDYQAELYRDAWDVTVKGSTSRVCDPEVYDRVMSWSRLRPWAGGTRTVVIELLPRSVDGRRVSSHS